MSASFTDRSDACWLGLALGDAYGRPLEFLRSHRVRTAPAGPGHDFIWTDDTHMSMYLGEAIVQHGPGPVDADRFGAAVGERFVDWRADPLTPSTAPGTTCLEGTRRWAETRNWRTSGVPTSDGCGAVMRIAPLAIAFSGADLRLAAEVQARLTHGHPNARQAAVAGCLILRELLEGAALTPSLVIRIADRLASEPGSSAEAEVVRAMRAAVAEARRTDSPWLDESAVPAGDGGWRAPSALGLALAAALRWGCALDGVVRPDAFQFAIDRAARINGDSDSVACLAGMFLGAAGGCDALPTAWLEVLPGRKRITSLAERVRAAGGPPARRRGERPEAMAMAEDTWPRADGPTTLVVADLHGHVAQLDALLRQADACLPDDYVLVTLGDYVDNGPDIPGLLDRLVSLRGARPDRFVPILGNHDLACLRAMGWPSGTPDPVWFKRWKQRYWNRDGSTPKAYGARCGASLRARMPAHHQAFLRSLPWCFDDGRHVFVHAGMEAGPLGPQLRRLAHRLLPSEHTALPPQIREKALCGISDPEWDRVVVSAHTYAPAKKAGIRGVGPHVMTPERICLSAEVDKTGVVFAVELPSRRVWKVNRRGQVSVAEPARGARAVA